MNYLFEEVKELIHVTTEALFYFRIQNTNRGYLISRRLINLLQRFVEKLAAQQMEELLEEYLTVLQNILDAMEQGDEIMMADIYEDILSPMLYNMQSMIFEVVDSVLYDGWRENREYLRNRDRNLYRLLLDYKDEVSDEYQLSFAKTGDLVMSVQRGNDRTIRLNSAVNPWDEAIKFVESNVSAEYDTYVVLGFGMGYHVEMLAKNPLCKKIIVLENDINQLSVAFSYRKLVHIITNENIEIVNCKDVEEYAKYINRPDVKCCVWYPSIKTIREPELASVIEQYWLESMSVKNDGRKLDDNFANNVSKKDEEVSGLKPDFKGKTMLLIGAGPSVDSEIEVLREKINENVVVFCVGKIAKKLIEQGIKIDYIVMTDANAGTRKRIEGIEACGIPLIYLSTVAASVVNSYKSKRYIAFQNDFAPAEEMAKDKKYHLYNTGGSVATFMLDMGIYMGFEQIIVLGLDMGYSGKSTHAGDVGRNVVNSNSLKEVEAVNGGTIMTSRTLDIYRRWIENRISGEKMEFINTSFGAKIKGMKDCRLVDIL